MRWTCTRDEKCPDAVERIISTLPEWFGLPHANREYIEAACSKETWTVRGDSGEIVGVTLVDRHFANVLELHFMAVDRSRRGEGIGRAMVTALEHDARSCSVALMEVKTLGPSHPDRGYADTRCFYEAMGFMPLEETDLWGEDNPCLFMVKPILMVKPIPHS